uniref:Uncharacterized protein n=1 Tax=Tanacetum cinerariifolium TaxID=118510 RepID=A0A699HIJ9_TANCI|nr:hypothetical protein [Tanacetum cinerariifolium]
MWKTGSYKTHEDYKNLYEALEKSMDRDHSDQLQADLAEARKKHKKRSDLPRTPSRSPPPHPPPPLPSLGASGASRSSILRDMILCHIEEKSENTCGFSVSSESKPFHDTRWDAKGFEFKHDYTIIESPRVVVFPVNNNEQKIMRFNEMYKFSDGTLTHILEALDYRVKEYRVNRLNPETQDQKDLLKLGMLCWWSRTDIDYRLLQRTE